MARKNDYLWFRYPSRIKRECERIKENCYSINNKEYKQAKPGLQYVFVSMKNKFVTKRELYTSMYESLCDYCFYKFRNKPKYVTKKVLLEMRNKNIKSTKLYMLFKVAIFEEQHLTDFTINEKNNNIFNWTATLYKKGVKTSDGIDPFSVCINDSNTNKSYLKHIQFFELLLIELGIDYIKCKDNETLFLIHV